MAFQKHAVAGKRIHARIERGQSRQRAIDEVTVMHHPMRMAVRLRFEGLLRGQLLARAELGDLALMMRGG